MHFSNGFSTKHCTDTVVAIEKGFKIHNKPHHPQKSSNEINHFHPAWHKIIIISNDDDLYRKKVKNVCFSIASGNPFTANEAIEQCSYRIQCNGILLLPKFIVMFSLCENPFEIRISRQLFYYFHCQCIHTIYWENGEKRKSFTFYSNKQFSMDMLIMVSDRSHCQIWISA